MRRGVVWLMVTVGLVSPMRTCTALTSRQVRAAMDRGVNYLRGQQRPGGNWPDIGAYTGGTTALATLALLTAGVPTNNPTVAAGLRALRALRSSKTYVVSLQVMALAMGEPGRDKRRIRELAELIASGHRGGRSRGGVWSYDLGRAGGGDNSNTQFALLGLKAAADAGVRIDDKVWRGCLQHWNRCQNRDGGWGYTRKGNSYGSMTCAGIASLVICGSSIQSTRARWVGGRVVNCGEYAQNVPLTKGILWLSRNFSVNNNPRGGGRWYYYYMYAMERAGRLTGQRLFGRHDWYVEGAEALLKRQHPRTGAWQMGGEPPLLGTSFALLFLAKGSYPVLINKLKRRGDWNNSRYDAHNLVAEVSRYWDYNMTWQVVDISQCGLKDLMMAPVLYLNGHRAPRFTDQEKRLLVRYVEQGGFILAEACCSRAEFDTGFRKLMKELFPQEGMQLRRIGPEHPIWTANFELEPGTYPLEAIDFGCRTSVVYSPTFISSLWEGPRGCPPALRLKAFRMGTNILAYATGKERPKDKLAEHVIVEVEKPDDSIKRTALEIAKIRHSGQWNVARTALPNLMGHLRKSANVDVIAQQRELSLQDPTLRVYPLAYMAGRAAFTFTDKDQQALRTYVDLGGTLFADATCGSQAFDQAFRQMIAQTFPKHPLERIPLDHALFTKVGFPIRKVEYTKAVVPKIETPYLEAVTFNARLAVIYSKYDLGCAMTRTSTFGCRGYKTDDAFRVAANIVLYVMTQ